MEDDATDDTPHPAVNCNFYKVHKKETPYLVCKAMGKLQFVSFWRGLLHAELYLTTTPSCRLVSTAGSCSSWKLSGSQCLASPGVQVIDRSTTCYRRWRNLPMRVHPCGGSARTSGKKLHPIRNSNASPSWCRFLLYICCLMEYNGPAWSAKNGVVIAHHHCMASPPMWMACMVRCAKLGDDAGNAGWEV